MEHDTGAVMSEFEWKEKFYSTQAPTVKRATKDLQWRTFKRHGSTSSPRRMQRSTLQVADPDCRGKWTNAPGPKLAEGN